MSNDKNNLLESAVKEISSRYIRTSDKFPRMFCGIASNLERYEDGIIYLRIENTERRLPSNYGTALDYARGWVRGNEELKDAKGFVVSFYKTRSTGLAMHGPDFLKDDTLFKIRLEELVTSYKEKKILTNTCSGMFADGVQAAVKMEEDKTIMNKMTLEKIAEMSDEEVFGLSVMLPHHPLGTGGYRGFTLSVQDFEDEKEMAECRDALMKRLEKIKKENTHEH